MQTEFYKDKKQVRANFDRMNNRIKSLVFNNNTL